MFEGHVNELEGLHTYSRHYPALSKPQSCKERMKIRSRLGFSNDERARPILCTLGINFPLTDVGVGIYTDDHRYQLILDSGLVDYELKLVEFDRNDLLVAPRVAMYGHEAGYPEPRHAPDLLERFLEYECRACGIYREQIADIQTYPKYTVRYDLFSLLLIDEPLFVREGAAADLLRNFGATFRSVRTTRGEVIPSVYQLNAPAISEAPLCVDSLQSELCVACGTIKYNFPNSSYMPSFQGDPGEGIRLSQEWFGSGRAAFKVTFFPPELCLALWDAKVKRPMYFPQAPAG